jgi:ankyrin repeat protein
MLLKTYPTAAQVQNNVGWLPLHMACGMKASPDIIEMLVEAFPEGVNIKNSEGNFPSDYLESEDSISPRVRPSFPSLPPIPEPPLPPYIDMMDTVNRPNYERKSQQTIFNDTNTGLLELCEEAYKRKDIASYNNVQKWLFRHENNHWLLEKAANNKNDYNVTPLHYLSGANPPSYLVETMLQLAPDTLKFRDADGKLPLHWACSNKTSRDVIRKLLKAYPDAAKLQNYDNGYTPLHDACRSGASINVVRMILEECTEAAQVQSIDGSLPLHIACEVEAFSDVLNLLIDHFPGSIKEINNEGMRPVDLVQDTNLKNVFVATLPKSYRNDRKNKNKIFIENKTGRQIMLVYRQALPPTFWKGFGASVGVDIFAVGGKAKKEERQHSTIHKQSRQLIQPNDKQAFMVREACKGINFDFLSQDDETKGWALNYFVKKGRTQELVGQPEQLKKQSFKATLKG